MNTTRTKETNVTNGTDVTKGTTGTNGAKVPKGKNGAKVPNEAKGKKHRKSVQIDLDELFASEEKYLDAYFRHPIRTDIRYFFLTIRSILFKGMHSA